MIKILKKSTGLVRFWFYKLEIEITEPNRDKKNQAKTSQTEKPSQTGFCSKKIEPNRNRSLLARLEE